MPDRDGIKNKIELIYYFCKYGLELDALHNYLMTNTISIIRRHGTYKEPETVVCLKKQFTFITNVQQMQKSRSR